MKRLCMMLAFLTLMTELADAQQQNNDVCMKVPPTTQTCLKQLKGENQLSSQINCLQDLLWSMAPNVRLDDNDRNFIANISRIIGVTVEATQLSAMSGESSANSGFQRYPRTGKRIRKEYRLLTKQERERFHLALKRLYKDGIMDIFGKIHGEASNIHHGGASFLPWHRVFITMFEEMLRLYDPSVSLPYWDSTLDDAMDNPVNSILWTPEYFGNGEGIVTSGPSAGWKTVQGLLQRDYGKNSTLLKREMIQTVLTQCRFANISRTTALQRFDFEEYHGGPHIWVGGDMGAIPTAAFDHVFYMHHAYIDYVWEQFRQRQRIVCGVDPSTDYPDVPVGDPNNRDARMVGFNYLTNWNGIESFWTDNWFSYEPSPTCPNCCPGCSNPPILYCDRRKNMCVPRSKLVDEQGQLSLNGAFSLVSGTHDMKSGWDARPRNRGTLFDGPPSDGRTVFTALQDAMIDVPTKQILGMK